MGEVVQVVDPLSSLVDKSKRRNSEDATPKKRDFNLQISIPDVHNRKRRSSQGSISSRYSVNLPSSFHAQPSLQLAEMPWDIMERLKDKNMNKLNQITSLDYYRDFQNQMLVDGMIDRDGDDDNYNFEDQYHLMAKS